MKKPNVIIVMTDDQGYGDLGCTGNPWIHTPNIDSFHDDSFRLADFHVSPLCTPTRGALMTGHRPIRNGAWATCWGRSILRRDEVTMADIFSDNGYKTGMFGKWHLGDNYPYRPQDRGFQHVVAHKGGGVGQTPDFWGNNYFDDTYFHNGDPKSHNGYCTDIWFKEATKFIEGNKDQPFFAYIATNAPHSPYLVAEKYRKRYEGNPNITEPAFYGMITNIDENFGRLVAKIKDLGIEDNTILIFMTDNGSSGGAILDKSSHVVRGYNAGMRGMKGSYYDGGHKAPFFIRWPEKNIEGGRDIDEMTLHVDVLPTLIDLCGLTMQDNIEFDGLSLASLLSGTTESLYDRFHFLQYHQSTHTPEKWKNAVITRDWRLIGGKELYNIKEDPSQMHNIAEQYPQLVEQMRDKHEEWWKNVSSILDQYCPISLGNDAENPTHLNAMDVMGDVVWTQTHIVLAQKSTGQWTVDVEKAGEYSFSLRRWPIELALPIDEVVSSEDANGHIYADGSGKSEAISPTHARIKIFDQEQIVAIKHGVEDVTFRVNLEQTGVTQLDAWFIDENGEERGAYYVYVQRL